VWCVVQLSQAKRQGLMGYMQMPIDRPHRPKVFTTNWFESSHEHC